MKEILSIIFFTTFFVHQTNGQSLKLSIDAGGSASKTSYVYNSLVGPYIIQGQYLFGTNISFPFFGYGFGLFVETNNKLAKLSGISFKSNNVSTGLCWRNPFGKSKIEFTGGFGYSWDKYELNDSRLDFFSITNSKSIFQGGITLYFPFFESVDMMIGGRLTKNNNSHIASSFKINNSDLEIPSLLYSGVAGLSFTLFGEDK